MAIVYCSWATGDDTTGDGTAANPYKTITKASTSRTASDEIRVAKSPDPTALTGTTAWTLNATTVTGVGTLFTTELAIGDFISAPDGQWYEVITIGSNTSATLYKKYPSATASGHASQKLGVTDTGAAGSSTTNIQTVSSSGNSSAFLYISGGWDLSTEMQTGQTWFRQMHGTFNNRYGRGLYLSSKNYVNIDKLKFLRYSTGMLLIGSDNNTITNATCNSNGGYGIYMDIKSDNNTITNATCNSNGGSGVALYAGSSNNTITNPVCNSNTDYGIEQSTNSGNINNKFINATCNSNGKSGFLLDGGYQNTIADPTCNSNSNYGILIGGAYKNNIRGTVSTSGNGTAAIGNTSGADIVIPNADISETIKSAGFVSSADTRVYINNNGYSYIGAENANVISRDAIAGGTGKEWVFNITGTNRGINYPFYIPVAQVAVASGSKVTVKIYIQKSGSGIAGGLRCKHGQIAWSDDAEDIVVLCPENTARNQITLEFTPTEAGVVEIEAGAWYVNATNQTVIIDDIEITQA